MVEREEQKEQLSAPVRFTDGEAEEDEVAVVERLKELHKEYEELKKKLDEEQKQLCDRYNSIFLDAFQKRRDEIENGKLRHFWLRTLRQSTLIADNLSVRDEDALAYLTDIRCDNLISEGSFSLEFQFAPNPFFENEVLTKVYEMDETDPFCLQRAIGCTINWKPGKDLTKRILRKKVRSGGGKNARKVVTKTETCDSFFHLFAPPQVPEASPQSPEESGDATIINEILEADFEIGDRIRSVIIPQAILWFTGEREDSEDEEEDDEAYLDEDDDEDDDEDPPLRGQGDDVDDDSYDSSD